MMTIGELAELAGVTPRAVRHYHAVGLLPEPLRRHHGYREYDARDLVRLLRTCRLRQLGLSLPEVRDALTGEDDRELREVVSELVADLARQESALRSQRERLPSRSCSRTPRLARLTHDPAARGTAPRTAW